MRTFLIVMILSGCTSAVRGTREPASESSTSQAATLATFKVSSARGLNPFAKITHPSSAPARVVGGYSNGCLFGAVRMPKSGPGFEMVRLSRNRDYAHPALAAVLIRAGEALASQATMLYGDLAQPRGGPMPGGHASHQSGLDADIWFHKFPAKKHMTDRQREHLQGSSVLRKDHLEINAKKWDETYTTQLMWFAGQPETERIFVNAAIKRRLCKQFPGDPRLARLRPWYFHDDHFHLRLKCPEGETACAPQEAAKGVECEEKDLAYWFSSEVIEKFSKSEPTPPFEANLPMECRSLIDGP